MKARPTQSRKGVKGQLPLAGSRDSVPCGVWGNAPTVPRATSIANALNKGAGSEASLPVTLRVRRRAPKLLFPQDSVKNRQKAPVRVECPDRGEFILFPNSIMRDKGIPRLRTRELVRRDASLPATKGAYLSAFGIAGGTSGSWGVTPSPSRDAVPAPCKGHCPLTLFWLPGLSALP